MRTWCFGESLFTGGVFFLGPMSLTLSSVLQSSVYKECSVTIKSSFSYLERRPVLLCFAIL